jgi:hypothetical protein
VQQRGIRAIASYNAARAECKSELTFWLLLFGVGALVPVGHKVAVEGEEAHLPPREPEAAKQDSTHNDSELSGNVQTAEDEPMRQAGSEMQRTR